MASPTARTLAALRRCGSLADPVERFVAHRNIRRDLWHFGDVLAVHPGRKEFLIVQSTTRPNVGARLAKARRPPELALWLRAGGRFEVHGWALRRGRWAAKVVEVLAADLTPVVLASPPRRRRARYQPGTLFGADEPGHTSGGPATAS